MRVWIKNCHAKLQIQYDFMVLEGSGNGPGMIPEWSWNGPRMAAEWSYTQFVEH